MIRRVLSALGLMAFLGFGVLSRLWLLLAIVAFFVVGGEKAFGAEKNGTVGCTIDGAVDSAEALTECQADPDFESVTKWFVGSCDSSTQNRADAVMNVLVALVKPGINIQKNTPSPSFWCDANHWGGKPERVVVLGFVHKQAVSR